MFKCECGFEAKSKLGLASQMRNCKALKKKEAKKEEFAIVDGGDNVIRVYSVKVHGKDAGKLAEMFSKQYNNYQIK
jgi:hypothetical protein